MRILPLLSTLAVLSFVTSCVGPPRGPVTPPPVRIVTPPAPAAPVTLPTDWRDWPQTPGDWRYVAGQYGSGAEFGSPGARVFNLGCDRASRRVTMTVERPSTVPTVTVRTTSVTRVIPIVVTGDPPTGGSARLAANDPLLDAMAFSRGRFVVQPAGAPPLVLPAWAEVGRVIEDCRG